MNRFDLGSFLWGCVFVVVGGALWAEQLGWWDLDFSSIRYLGPVLLLVIGVIVFATSFRSRPEA